MARFEQSTRSFTARHAMRGGLIACGAVLAACSSLLGIEDLDTEPRDSAHGGAGQAGSASGAVGGKAGGTGSGGTAGGTAARGGSAGSSGAAGSGAPGGASSGGSAGAGAGGNSGTGGSAGGSAGTGGIVGNGGEGGMPEPMTGPVTVTIIDFWHHPLSGVPARIGDQTATTDQAGKFTIADVAATYDAAFIVTQPNPMTVHEWVFVGLTRRDPTLQVIHGFSENEAHFYVTQVNGNGGNDFDEGFWYLAIGSANGSRASTANSAGFDIRPTWQGPAMNDWTLHSLFMEKTAGIPTQYVAYETQTATSNASTNIMQQDFEMDLAPQDIDMGTVSGAIESSGQGRTNSAFVRFSTGAALPIVDRVETSAQSYQYPVPSLPNGDITIAAAEDRTDGGYAIAHTDRHILGQSGIDIVIPPAVTGLVPLDETVDVGPDTVLSFAQGDPDNTGYLVQIESADYQQGVFIVTAQRQVTLSQVPLINNTSLIIPNGWHTWHVETHGQFDSVDAMATPTGFLDPFTIDNRLPQGPSKADGAFTASYYTDFRTLP